MQTISPIPHFVAFSQAVLFPAQTSRWRPLAAMVIIGAVYYAVAQTWFKRVIFGG